MFTDLLIRKPHFITLLEKYLKKSGLLLKILYLQKILSRGYCKKFSYKSL